MNSLLHRLARHGDIDWLSYYFAEFIANQDDSPLDDLPALSAAVVSEANLAGNVCIELERFHGEPLFRSARLQGDEIPRGLASEEWRARLLASDCVGDPGLRSPLTLDRGRLYLNRFWFYEDFVARRIAAMLTRDKRDETAAVQRRIDALFDRDDQADADQMQAVLTAAVHPFCVISGGPGSGKTSTVVRILALLLALDPGCRITLAAPTGKAAARMLDSIRGRIDQLDIDARVKQAIPDEARTIHRLLRYRHHAFDYNQQHPLATDCVVIDEASMIDLKLMYHLLAALPDHARLILLGDRDQLASVAAGNVLGDITGHGLEMADAAPAVAESLALLRHNYRFGGDSPISALAALVNQGESDAALAMLRSAPAGIRWHDNALDDIEDAALESVLRAYQALFDAETPLAALDAFDQSRLLCATNSGPLGVDALNRRISDAMLTRNGLPADELFPGLPILITRNQHELGLYNGDTGIIWPSDDGLQACFRATGEEVRRFAVNRLGEFSPAWAMTVHKSQGSEFDAVLLVLPADPDNEILSRELLYTAITRARRQFTLHAGEAVVGRAVAGLTRRHSGLAERLGWPRQN